MYMGPVLTELLGADSHTSWLSYMQLLELHQFPVFLKVITLQGI